MSETTALTDFAAETTLDPLGFVLAAFPWGQAGTELADYDGPREWQAERLQAIGDGLRQGYTLGQLMPVLLATASGHGIGKSALVSMVACWAMCTCEDTRLVVTANTEDQVRTKTWVEITKWFRLLIFQRAQRPWFKVRGFTIHSTIPGREKTWRADAVTWSATNLEAFAGLHNKGKRIVVIFDEASGITDRVWEVAEGALTDEDTEILWLAFGNPTQPTGRFFEAIEGKQRHRWRPKQIDSRAVPGTNKALFDEWQEAYGEDSDFFRVRVRGMFPRAGSMQFISSEVVDAATRRDVHTDLDDALIMGVDVARFGEDMTVIVFRKGRECASIPPIKLRKQDNVQVANRVMLEAANYRASAVFVDETGIGTGVVDVLRTMRCPGMMPVNFGGKPTRGGVQGTESIAKYADKSAEMWGLMRAWLEGARIPDDADLRADLTGRWYSFNANSEIVMERKKDMKQRGLASPDMADALALTFAYPVAPRAGSGHALVPTMPARTYDPFAGY